MDRDEYDWRSRAQADTGLCVHDSSPRGIAHQILHAVPWAREASCETIGPALTTVGGPFLREVFDHLSYSVDWKLGNYAWRRFMYWCRKKNRKKRRIERATRRSRR